MMIECQTCHGKYEPVLPDGTLYFHRCPPLSSAELRAALDAGTVQLADADQARLAAARAFDAEHPPAEHQPPQAEIVLASITIDRPNMRDENIQGGRDPKLADRRKAGADRRRPYV